VARGSVIQSLFVFAAMACLTVPAAMALGVWTGIIPPPPPLAGVEQTIARPDLSVAGLWSGAYARQFTAWFSRNNVAVPAAVAARNQAYFSLLRQSSVPAVVVGRGLQLLEGLYIDEYCRRNIAALTPAAEAWAEKLAAMQRWYASRNRAFVYVITPDKPATYPDYIPAGWPCRAAPADREGMLPAWRAILAQHGVAFVDGPAIVAAAKPNYPFPMFPRGGTHWNWVAAGLTTQALVREIDRQRPGSLADFTFTWRLSEPAGTDRDLTDLLNLPYPRLDYRTPVLDIYAPPPATCDAPNLAVVGGSFTFHLLMVLDRLPCPPRSDFYSYFTFEHVGFPGFVRSTLIDPSLRGRQLLDTADVVVLEENEDRVFRSRHAEQLWALVQSRIPER
jgi:alginate O-acetyltransferase complex protein AlgJ